ncbi:glycosyltransferase [Rhodopseudomonas sp. WA056]|uniref:glycosyltransferase n=1 Tax=Rhodopseudomonas sp. WA056 TaxID=2269367 RepID=UPI0013E01AB3
MSTPNFEHPVVVVVAPLSADSELARFSEMLGAHYPVLAIHDASQIQRPAESSSQPPESGGCGHSLDGNSSYYNRLNRALHPMIASGRDVLFVSPDFEFSSEAVAQLARSLHSDPLFGVAIPRTTHGGSAPLPGLADDGAAADVLLSLLPPIKQGLYRGGPVLVRNSLLRTFGPLCGNERDLCGALTRLFIRANRRGFGAVISNRALLRATRKDVVRSTPAILYDRASDYYKAIKLYSDLPEDQAEKLLWQRIRTKAESAVLIDIRNLQAAHNGTAQHIVSLLSPLTRLARQYKLELSFWVHKEAADFHGLESIIPSGLIFEVEPGVVFDAAVRLTQPWSFTEVRDLARLASVNFHLILDLIAWDCHYIRMPHYDGVLRMVAEFSDGLFFISEYTRDRVHRRFPSSQRIPYSIAYCSLDPREYFSNPVGKVGNSNEPYVAVVGNKYFHKGLAETVPVLAKAFPETAIKVLGDVECDLPNVERLPPGRLDHDSVALLYRDAACVVMPSFYEGFGLPILHALSFSKPAIVRHSALVDEIREKTNPVGEIIPFSDTNELLRAVRRVLARPKHAHEPLPPCSPENVVGWEQSAAVILGAVTDALSKIDFNSSLERLKFFYLEDQFAIERAGWSNSTQNAVIFEAEAPE